MSGRVQAVWSFEEFDGARSRWRVERTCTDCGAQWLAYERICATHPGGVDRAAIDRDSAAQAAHPCPAAAETPRQTISS